MAQKNKKINKKTSRLTALSYFHLKLLIFLPQVDISFTHIPQGTDLYTHRQHLTLNESPNPFCHNVLPYKGIPLRCRIFVFKGRVSAK